jgi:hypothetical protein
MRSLVVLLTALALAIPSRPAAGLAHEEAVLRSSRSSVAAGDVVPLQGAEFEPGGRYTLRLVGPLREYALEAVEADSVGEFSMDVTIAAAVVPGAYKIEAVALDGDVAARLDITVLPAAQAPSGEDGHAGVMGEDMQLGKRGTAAMARSDDIQIDRDRSAIEWGLIGLLIGAAAGLGSGLLIAGRAGSDLDA